MQQLSPFVRYMVRMHSERETPMDPNTQAVIEQYYTALYRLAFSICQNVQDAEDSVQETFLRYLKRAPEFPGEQQRRSWLMTVTANRCRDLLRRRRREAPLSETIPDEPRDIYPELAEAMKQLDARDRAILYLTYYEQCTSQEIGHVLHLPAATVRSRLKRARAKLKAMLMEESLNE